MQIYNPFEQSTGKVSISKGNQLKMCVNNMWYKADFLGYEGAAEYVCSDLLKQSNIGDFVEYTLEKISLNNNLYLGCSAPNFLKSGEELITAHKLFLLYKGIVLDSYLQKMPLKDKIQFFVNTVEDITHIADFGAYLTQMLEWDMFVFNEDRHFNNIAFIKSPTGFKNAPFFDNGAAFLSDTREDYPLHKRIYGLLPDVQSKPFSTDFEKQVNACVNLYGSQLCFNEDLHISTAIQEDICTMYGDIVLNRINNIFEKQSAYYRKFLVGESSISHPIDTR